MKRVLRFLQRCDDPECWLNAAVIGLVLAAVAVVHVCLWVYGLGGAFRP